MKKVFTVIFVGFVLVMSACTTEVRRYLPDWTTEERAEWDGKWMKNWATLEHVETLFFATGYTNLDLEIQQEFDAFYESLRSVHESELTFAESMDSMITIASNLEAILNHLLTLDYQVEGSSTSAFNNFFNSYLKTIGDVNFGFIDIPENWIRFVDASGVQGLIQYTDVGWNIITISVGEVENLDLSEIRTAHLSAIGGDVITDDGALELSHLGNAYYYLTNIGGKYLKSIFAERPTTMLGNLQLITLEGSRAEIEELTRLVEQTFRFNR